VFECEIRSDEGSTLLSCFGDDDPIRESCDDLIANGKIKWFWFGSDWEYRKETSSLLYDLFEKTMILWWITDVHSTTEDRNRISIILECFTMRDTIDPVGSSAHNASPFSYEISKDMFDHLCSIRCTLTGSDDSEGEWSLSEGSSDIEEIWCLFYGSEFFRIGFIFEGDDAYVF
jgi:hypothetical protein